MTQTFNCPTCSAPLDYDGRGLPTVRCPYCQNSVVVPEELRVRAVEVGSPEEELPTTPVTPDIDVRARMHSVEELVHAGNKIAAIKVLRETYEISLKEAKEVAEAIERGEMVDLSGLRVTAPTTIHATTIDPATTEKLRVLIESGQKLDAIKLYRKVTGTELAAASDAVEAMEKGFTAIKFFGSTQTYPENIPTITIDQSTTRRVAKTAGAAAGGLGCLTVGLVLFILLVTVVPILIAMTATSGPLSEPWSRINPFSPARMSLVFGGEGTGPGLFQDPRFVAVDNKGHIFVGEFDGGRIQVFDDSGKFITQWTARGAETGDIYISSMAADRQGNVYVVVGSRLFRYDGLNGQLLAEVEHGEGWGYDSVTVSPDGSLVVSWDRSTDDILRYTPDGRIDLTIKSAISSVSDESESGIKLAVDGLGNIFALGTFNESVFKFAPDGRFITRFGSEGDEKGQFTSVYAIAVDNQSRVYVTDFGGIVIFALDGRYLDKIPTDSYIYGMTFNDQNQLFTVDANAKVKVWDLSK